MKLIFKILPVLLTFAASSAVCGQDVDPLEARQIAKEAYIYGFPLVENYRVQYARFGGGWNSIRELPVDSSETYPKQDTLNAYVAVDLRTEPQIVEVLPHSDDRYYTIQFSDLYTYNFAHLGSRISNTNFGVFLLTGPNWKPFHDWKPVGVYQVIRCDTDFAFLFYRTVLNGAGDLDGAAAVRQDFKIYSLSAYNGETAPAPVASVAFMPPLSSEMERTSLQFFSELNFLLQFCPTLPSEKDLLARFAKLGIGPGLNFEPLYYDAPIQAAIKQGMADAWKALDDARKKLDSGSLAFSSLYGSRDELGNNYINRMLGAVEGLNTDSKIELDEERYAVDSIGKALSGKTNRYDLHFTAEQIPPVNGTWSVTLYSAPTKQYFQNPLGRYSINSSMLPLLARDADGGLTIAVQRDAPEGAMAANWLPVPGGPFLLSLRLYGPKPQAFDGSWSKPVLKRL